MSINNKLRR